MRGKRKRWYGNKWTAATQEFRVDADAKPTSWLHHHTFKSQI